MTTKTNISPELVLRFKELADDFEALIRTEERNRIAALFEQAAAEAAAESEPQRSDQTDMHGEPVNTRTVTTQRIRLSAKHEEIVDLLSQGRWMAAPTIAGLVDLQRITVWNYLNQIKHSGLYRLEEKQVSQLDRKRRGYTKLWRIASAA